MKRAWFLRGMACVLGLCVAIEAAVALAASGGAAARTPLVRPLPPSRDAEVSSFEVPAALEPRLDRRRLLELLHRRVKYVFVLFQENRSFDFCFGSFPGVDGLYSQPASSTPGFTQGLENPDGSLSPIHPFRIGPAQEAADLDDVDHSHPGMAAKMDVVDGQARMDRFALAEERGDEKKGGKIAAGKRLALLARRIGEITMAHVDGDTIPALWRYADRFVIFDHVFQLVVGPSTPGAVSIIAAQSGQTQAALHPSELAQGSGAKGPGEPLLNDDLPPWGSPEDRSASRPPVNPSDFSGKKGKPKDVAYNQTYASLPLTLAGSQAGSQTAADPRRGDLSDLGADLAALDRRRGGAIGWGWYQEGYGGDHTAYVTHHNGAQYFGYIMHSPAMASKIHDLPEFFTDVRDGRLPKGGGVFYVRGGLHNSFGLTSSDPELEARRKDLKGKDQYRFLGDDDHPADSDSRISEDLLARSINAIARSRYWNQCAIIITYDESGGFYDHVPPPLRAQGPDHQVLDDGPRIPLLLISPYDRAHTVVGETGDQGSVIKFADAVFGLTPLAELPDERKGRRLGKKLWGQSDWGPDDAETQGVSDLVDALDPARLSGAAPLLPPSYAVIPDGLLDDSPRARAFGLKDIGVVPTDQGLPDPIPPDFRSHPLTDRLLKEAGD